MRGLVDASRVYLSVAGPGGLVESRPKLHGELVMATRGCSWNPIGNKAVNPKLAASAPHSTHRCPLDRLRAVHTICLHIC